jgi:hypothetical protein
MEALAGDGHAVDFVPSRWIQQGHAAFNDCVRIRAGG